MARRRKRNRPAGDIQEILAGGSELDLGSLARLTDHQRAVLNVAEWRDKTGTAKQIAQDAGLAAGPAGKAMRKLSKLGLMNSRGTRGRSALWEIAEYYFSKKQYPEAEKIYERLVRDYSDGNWGEEAEYKFALSVYKQIRGVDYDQAPLKTAKRRFDLYRSHYPRGVRINEVLWT